jgi:hypothetical protein
MLKAPLVANTRSSRPRCSTSNWFAPAARTWETMSLSTSACSDRAIADLDSAIGAVVEDLVGVSGRLDSPSAALRSRQIQATAVDPPDNSRSPVVRRFAVDLGKLRKGNPFADLEQARRLNDEDGHGLSAFNMGLINRPPSPVIDGLYTDSKTAMAHLSATEWFLTRALARSKAPLLASSSSIPKPTTISGVGSMVGGSITTKAAMQLARATNSDRRKRMRWPSKSATFKSVARDGPNWFWCESVR